MQDSDQFELIAACELFEHLLEPEEVLHKLFVHADTVFLATQLQPKVLPRDINDWWYFFPENGQHVTFYTPEALQRLARATGSTLYSDGESLHLLTTRELSSSPFQKSRSILRRLDRALGRWRACLRNKMYAAKPPTSLLPHDTQRVRQNFPFSPTSSLYPPKSQ